MLVSDVEDIDDMLKKVCKRIELSPSPAMFALLTTIYYMIQSHSFQIYKLITHIVNIDYDIFCPANLEYWEASLQYFRRELEIAETQSKTILDGCIENLK